MSQLMSLVCLVLRALRPVRGLHAAPRAVRRDVQEEARARKANRVRRYAEPLPALPSGSGHASAAPAALVPGYAAPAVLVPVPADYVPVVDPWETYEPAAMVRGFYRAHEARQERAYADRQRTTVSVLRELATSTTEVLV